MDDKKKNRKNSKELKHLDMDTVNAASSMECTGLVPANPQADEELESYKQVYETETSALE